METERLIIDSIRETDKEDYFTNISHDKKVQGEGEPEITRMYVHR